MPIHHWKDAQSGIFHHFHHAIIENSSQFLNGVLPGEYYALAEQVTGVFGPDVVTLQLPTIPPMEPAGGVAVLEHPPQVKYRRLPESDRLLNKAKSVTIRHTSNHRIVAVVEVVSPANKASQSSLRQFVEKAVGFLQQGVHLLIIDFFPPSQRDPNGIHLAIWDEIEPDSGFELPIETPMTLAAYRAKPLLTAYVQPVGFEQALPDMPIFLTTDRYIPVALENIYQSSWASVPKYWQNEIRKLSADPASTKQPDQTADPE